MRDVLLFFCAGVVDKEHFDKIVEICLNNPEVANTQRPIFIKKGQFSLGDCMHYWHKTHGSGPMPNIIIEEVIKRLCDCKVLHRSEYLLRYGMQQKRLQATAGGPYLIVQDWLLGL